jgi:hypothetical protein
MGLCRHPHLIFALALACLSPGLAKAETSEKRATPDYDGRGPRPTTLGEGLLWAPRVLLAPPYFVSEYLLRRPLGLAIASAERAGLPAKIYDFFAFGPDHRAGIIPAASIDFGFQPNVGLYMFWNDALERGHDLRLRGATWGKDWLSGAFSERFHVGRNRYDHFALDASALRRPDYMFFGLGPNTRSSQRVRFGRDTLHAQASYDQRLWRFSSFRAELGVESVDFRRGGVENDETLDQAIEAGTIAAPAGYPRGYALLRSTLSAAYDSRLPRPTQGSGVRAEGTVSHAAELHENDSFLSYGATVGGFWDLTEHRRVVSLSASVHFVDPLSRAAVPFTELAELGGTEEMRGFYPGRLVDRSSAVLGLGYRWPIWIWLDGELRSELGDVFGEHLSGFEPRLLRWSSVLGIVSTGSTDMGLEFLAGLGSETFASGGKVDSLRVVLGTTHGF